MAFLEGESELGVSEIGRRTALTKSTVHRILASLSSMGLLALNPTTHLYRPGPAMVAIGARALQDDYLHHAAVPVLQRLWETTGETVGMSVPLGATRVCTDQLVSRKDLSARANVGYRIPLLPGASGLVMVAFLPEECVWDRAQLSHKVSLLDIEMKYGDVRSTSEVIDYVKNLPAP